jgi:N-acetylglucosaminyl-diphospho-decaprenol L-rhamnosyltransferase
VPLNVESASTPTVSIIVVTYQSQNFIGSCLRSVKKHAGMQVETIVVDNASTDATLERIREADGDAEFVPLRRNTGFAAASNVGASLARGRYLLFLNPDAELLPEALPRMVAYLDASPCVAAVGPRLIYADGRSQDSAFTYPSLLMTWLEFFPRPGRLIHTRLNGRIASPDGQPVEIVHPLGACMLVRRAAWDQVGPFDRGFFLYCEEVDWCMRARARGWTIVHLPSATAIHHEGRSAANARAASLVHLYTSRARLHRKYRGRLFQAAATFITTLGLAHTLRQLIRQYRRGPAGEDSDVAARIEGIERILARR